MIQNDQKEDHGESHIAMPIRPLIFLDLDDVLAINPLYTREHVLTAFKVPANDYSALWNNLFCKTACENLRIIHLEFSPSYVVSSNWARHLSQDQFRQLFQCTNLDFVAENLHIHWATPKGTGSPRLTEIEDWILLYRRLDEAILVLDDDESGWSLHDSNLDRQGCVVLCEVHQGFNATRLAHAQKLLRTQLCIT